MNIFLRMEGMVKGQPLDKLYQITGAEFVEAIDAWYIMREKAETIRDFYQQKYEGKVTSHKQTQPIAIAGPDISIEGEEGTGQAVHEELSTNNGD